MKSWYRSHGADGFVIFVKAKPRASKSRLVGITAEGDALEIAVAAPPVDGEANEALVEFLAKALHIKKSALEIFKGGQSRHKQVVVHGIEEDRILELILASTPRR